MLQLKEVNALELLYSGKNHFESLKTHVVLCSVAAFCNRNVNQCSQYENVTSGVINVD